MTRRVGIIGSSSGASTVPGWNDYEFQQIERSLLTKGVIQGIGDAFAVSERGAGANMSVDVGAGRALIEITNANLAHGKTYKVWFDSDATENIVVPTADATNPRKDRIVLRVDVATDPDGSTGNIAIIELLAGTPAGSPTATATPANAISLAIIDVPASDTTITDGQITDDRSYVEMNSAVLADVARLDDLASIANGKGASLIGVEDSGGNFAASNLEAVLAELVTIIGTSTATTNSVVLAKAVDSTTIGDSSSSEIDFDTYTDNIDANTLVADVQYRFKLVINMTRANNSCTFRLKLGSTAIVALSFAGTSVTGEIEIEGVIAGTQSAGSSVNVRGHMRGRHQANGTILADYAEVGGIATDGALTLQFSAQWDGATAGNTNTIVMGHIEKISSTPFA